jgi:1,4-dihydroxy-2-naphthoyl-CoA hydrolase
MSLWKRTSSVAELNRLCEGTIHDSLGIQFTALTDDSISATMPVDERTVQPIGLLHGGASVVLAESLGSMASILAVEEGTLAVGVEVNANHVRAARNGIVTGTARPIHIGQTIHVWSIEIRDSTGQIVCVSRLTTSIRAPKARPA